MMIGYVGEYLFKEGKHHFSEEASSFINFFNLEHELYVIKTSDPKMKGNYIQAMCLNDQHIDLVDIASFDAIYFGLIGHKIIKYNLDNGLTNELEDVCKILDGLKSYEGKEVNLVNPAETIISNMSKEYILNLSRNTNLPFIPTKKIESLEELLQLKKEKRKFSVKPLISERANGTYVLNDMNEGEIKQYFNKFGGNYNESERSHSNVIDSQGIIVQPYNKGFMRSGEKKIAVVDGEVTLSRRTVPLKSSNKYSIVAPTNGAKMERYEPTSREKELVLCAYEAFSHFYPAYFVRVDLVGSKSSLRINEIEAINPSFTTRFDFFSKYELDNHHQRLLDSFQKIN
jgi:glutathione synthase/RimK-type ligase-like ATP-grasp enzyme